MTLLQGIGLFLALIFITPAAAQTSLTSDWPCKQVRVAEMSLTGVINHPEISAEKKSWRDNPGAGGQHRHARDVQKTRRMQVGHAQ